MFIVTVYPLQLIHPPHGRGALSYFSSKKLTRGALVEILLRKTAVHAVVAHTAPIQEKKMLLKTSHFQMRRIAAVLSEKPIFHPILLTLAEEISRHTLMQEGIIIKHFLPAHILKKYTALETSTKSAQSSYEKEKPIYIVGDFPSRTIQYKNILQKKKKKQGVVWIVSPTIARAEYIYHHIRLKGAKTILLHSGLRAATLTVNWKAALQERNAVIIGTPIVIGTLREHIDTIILDEASSPHLRYPHIPFINIRRVLWRAAALANALYVEGSLTLYPDTMLALEQCAAELVKTRKKKTSTSIIRVDMQKEKEAIKEFPVISKVLADRISKTSSRVMLFINRRGYSPLALCRDCSMPLFCTHCSSPITLHQKNTTWTFMCHHCGRTVSADTQCAHCHSWNVGAYGIGTQRVEEEIKKIAHKRPIFRLDSDSVKNEKERRRVTEQFLNTTNGILIGTEMLFEEPILTCALSGIVNIDHMLTVPDFRVSEYIGKILEELKARSKNMVLQSFLSGHPLFDSFMQGTLDQYFANELAERREAFLPPFSLLIKLETTDMSKKKLDAKIDATEQRLQQITKIAESQEAFIQRIAGKWRKYIIIRVTPRQWQQNEEQLRNALRQLDRSWSIVIDPQSIL